jgi:hypothetical protein
MKTLAIIVALLAPATHILAHEPARISDEEINKILRAKEIVRQMVNYPDTLVFHEFKTKVSGNTVTLTFTCKNAFGVPETHTKDIKVN